MVNRRQIIQLALSAGAALPCLGAFAATAAKLALYGVLYDERSQPGLRFAAAASRHGARLLPTRGDVTDIWFNQLQPQWKQHQSAVAGLTDYHALFVLDMMARDAGMRAVYMAAHRAQAGGVFEHRLFGPRTLLRQASTQIVGDDWADRAAQVLMQCPGEMPVAARQSTIAQARNCELRSADLVSWVIAPVRRA
jgi:hypothetical protein